MRRMWPHFEHGGRVVLTGMTKRLLCFSIAVLLAASSLARAAEDPVRAAETLAELKDEIADSELRQQQLVAAAKVVALAERELSDKLIAVSADVQDKQRLLGDLETRSDELAEEQVVISKSLERKKAVLARMLGGLQKLEQNPPPALVVAPHDIISALRGAMVFGAVVPTMKDEANALATDLKHHKSVSDQLQQARTEAAETFAALQASRLELSGLLNKKREMALALDSELDQTTARIQKLAKQAKSLEQLLGQIAELKAREEAEKTAERAAVDAELARQRAILAQPRIAMSKARGRLDYPVQGRVLAKFGETGDNGKAVQGVIFSARKDADVISPINGTVAFAGPFRSYDQVLILDAGDGYLVLMAGMSRISAVTGQAVIAGETVGQIGRNAGQVIAGQIGGAQPALYVEFRKQGRPIDPSPWWIGSRKEAMR
jgi:murein hydrolase activator